MDGRTRASDFRVITKLGSGSFGTVFKVLRYADQQEYVIKDIRIVDLTKKEQMNAVNEVKLLAKIKCDFVVKYYDYYIDNESLHIVMEYCNKGDLSHLIKRAKEKSSPTGLKTDIVWSIILQIMLGLHYLHSMKILHRDLKRCCFPSIVCHKMTSSANVFLSSKYGKFEVKIGDLGVAKLLVRIF